MKKKNAFLFALRACLYLLLEMVWSIAMMTLASLSVQYRFNGGNPILIFSAVSVAFSSYVLMGVIAYLLRRNEQDKAYGRFCSLYWLYAFIGLVIAVFVSAYVWPRFHFLAFVDGKGFDYVVSYLAFALLSGVLPLILIQKKKKEGGVPNGGTI